MEDVILLDIYVDDNGEPSPIPTVHVQRIKTTWAWFYNYGWMYVKALLV
jgi:hypothetical protein